MSIARQHNEWLSLIEISGPFLSLPVLLRVFPQGLDAHDTEMSKNVRLAFGEWEEHRQEVAIHTAWLEFVLKRTLGYPDDYLLTGQALPDGLEARVHEHGETLRPTYALKAPTETLSRMLVSVYPPSQALTKPVAGTTWKTGSPDTRMMTLLHATGVPVGLVTNGEKWLLVAARPGETTSYITWDAGLWSEEPLTLRAFVSLLGVARFFGVAASETLPNMLAESALNQQEVTDQLGQQVLKAVEVLVQALDRIDNEQQGRLLRGIGEKDLYQAALTVMMRLVFLFSAEERELLLLGDALYDRHYAVSTLRDQLREVTDEQLLEHRHDAWARLLATCRVIYGGVEHEAMRLPAYGGSLFDPDRYPFLEGRDAGTTWADTPAVPLPISNRTVLHLLESLQFLRVRVAGGGIESRRLSFRALDIEQIGHVYEGLLDHTAKRAYSTVLGLKGGNGDIEVTLDELEDLARRGEDSLVSFLKERTGRTPAAIRKALAETESVNSLRLRTACGDADQLYERIKRFLLLMREDANGYPIVIHQGSVYVTFGVDRRSTGTHYTPRTLTETVVKTTLEPLVYEGVDHGAEPTPVRLKAPAEILRLKVCDFACGSGAFLVQACRYLSERLVEAWAQAEAQQPGVSLVIPEALETSCHHTEQLLPVDLDERLAVARRLVAERCIYGVDVNPMAVEMAKLSLWLVTLHRNRPFTFLDHAVKCGDSLVGLHSAGQIASFHLLPSRAHKRLHDYVKQQYEQLLNDARLKREELESFTVLGITDAEAKQALNQEAEAALESVRVLADLVVGAGMWAAGTNISRSFKLLDTKLDELLLDAGAVLNSEGNDVLDKYSGLSSLRQAADSLLNTSWPAGNRRTFHWLVEFPEVFLRTESPGFDAVVGNPPFVGGKKISGLLGDNYRDYQVIIAADGRKGHADLCAYFFLRAAQLVKVGGNFGLLAVNTIAEGDTREVGLEAMLQTGVTIYAATPSFPWPGVAAVEASAVYLRKGKWQGRFSLNEADVPTISAFLSGEEEWSPMRLKSNQGKSFIGSYVLGMGFTLSEAEAKALIERDPRNVEVLFPYMNGEDLNSKADQQPSRWVINFWDWPLARDADGKWDDADEAQRARWIQNGSVPLDYPEAVAKDFPEVYAIAETKVKPERQRTNADGSFALRKPLPQRWWQYADKRPALYHTIGRGDVFARHPDTWDSNAAPMRQVLVYTLHTKFWCPDMVPAEMVFSHALGINAMHSYCDFALLQSSIHGEWAWKLASSLESRLRYTPSDVLEPFPFPEKYIHLESFGAEYLAARREIMRSEGIGLTQTYNLFHDSDCAARNVVHLRSLHVAIDQAVIASYGWHDIELRHDFYAVEYLPPNDRMRFTVCGDARLEIVRRLMRLNKERYELEQRMATAVTEAAAADQGRKRSNRSQAVAAGLQADLF